MSRAMPIVAAQEDAAFGVAQLRQTLALVARFAGELHDDTGWPTALDEDAALASAYADVPDIARRRFDAVAADAAAYAAVGVRALIGREGEPGARAAAACLAAEMRRSLETLAGLLLAGRRA